MIEVKQAISIALNSIGDMFEVDKIIDPRLEEIELSEDEKLWRVTVSFVRGTSPGALAAKLGAVGNREYKVATIESETGKVLGVKIRQLIA